MRSVERLMVYYKGDHVGTMALTRDHRAAFEYADSWIKNGFSISPFSLPLRKEVFVPGKMHFQGLFGVFADSLPDSWGQLLLSRLLKKNGISMDELTVLDRLAIVGSSGMGALEYRPEIVLNITETHLNLDRLAEECQKILTTEYSENLDELYRLGGSSGGARPKIMTEVDGEPWIIKFPAHVDRPDAGVMEYEYSLCAGHCGISMTETRLFPSETAGGYFGTKRFDRIKHEDGTVEKVHTLTAAALLELDFRQPSLDYHSLMKLTNILTGQSAENLEQMFRLMCFNVFAHNRDDHSKNFTYIYDEDADAWRLSPAYDLTYSTTYFGEHTTSVDGNGRNPGKKELMTVGMGAGLKKKFCQSVIKDVEECVKSELGRYL